MRNLRFTIVALSFFSLGFSQLASASNFVRWQPRQTVNKTLTSDGVTFKVVSKNVLQHQGDLRSNDHLRLFDGDNSALILGFPRELIGQQNVFGGVVTAVSATKDENLGGLKLADLSPLHVQTVLNADATALLLNGCEINCDESVEPTTLFSIPVSYTDSQFIYLDLTTFGEGLDFFREMGDETSKAVATRVKSFDFSLSTLVFDVENTYQETGEEGEEPISFSLTTRWYLKLSSAFNPTFASHAPNASAGYFTTMRNKTTLITRFAAANGRPAIAKYYIKNVPEEYRQAFIDGFEDWNVMLMPTLGKKMLEYEFLETYDPRYNQIQIGDVRYNVLEWDLVNLAGYGGLGPSVANQMTGETFSANVYIQGPKIVELYTKWWRASKQAKNLEAQGQLLAAQELRMRYVQEMMAMNKKVATGHLKLASLPFNNPAADPRLSDEALDANDFIDTPAGYTYETYMQGYFREMVAHELGHNIGLRHNFRGNLSDAGTGHVASVSRSVMEYLGRSHRHLNRVSEYDVMAIAYGYKNVTPTHTDWFCTDDDQTSAEQFENSAECSNSDATNDPFAFYQERLQRALDFLILPGSEMAPIWNVDVLKVQIAPVVSGLANYYVSTHTNFDKWTNFVNPKRNVTSETAPGYVLNAIASQICNPEIDRMIAKKTQEGQAKARENIANFRALFKEITSEYTRPHNGFTKENFSCLAD